MGHDNEIMLVIVKNILDNILTINATVSFSGLDRTLWQIPAQCPPNPYRFNLVIQLVQFAAIFAVRCGHMIELKVMKHEPLPGPVHKIHTFFTYSFPFDSLEQAGSDHRRDILKMENHCMEGALSLLRGKLPPNQAPCVKEINTSIVHSRLDFGVYLL